MDPVKKAAEEAAEAGALPCPCCGSAPMLLGMTCLLPRVTEGDDVGKIGCAVLCSNDECRLGTGISWNGANGGIVKCVERWNRRSVT